MAEHAAVPVMAARPLLVLVLASLATAQHQTFRQQPGDSEQVKVGEHPGPGTLKHLAVIPEL